ncbi:diguanylate cyclase domain-containing protein [Lentisalinibacter orientalis]|uniref:diguanylate cyclase domain-containing protein n=1 Tax=Lentisalinibacter orientalis TaxID=2992241 RepID=UPI00386B25AD
MTERESLNGKPAPSAVSPDRVLSRGRDDGGKASYPEQPALMSIRHDPGSRYPKWSGDQQLSAALRQIDDLLKLNTLLKAECSLLAESLAQARRFAYHDPLTGLPNLRVLADRFDQAAAQAIRKHNYVVLFFLGLDGFREISNAIGYTAADRLLQRMASRLSSCVRSSDTVCRYGGEELVVLLPDIDRRGQAVGVCEKIRHELARPYVIDGTSVRATASLGMATFPTEGTDCLNLIRSADQAMDREKGEKSAAL